jgi:predicted Zn-dependent protease
VRRVLFVACALAALFAGAEAAPADGPNKGRPGAGAGAGPRGSRGGFRPSAAVAAGPAAERKGLDPSQAGGRMSPQKRGNMLLQRGMYRVAVSAFEEAVAADPTSPGAHVGLGVSFARNGNCAEALPEFRDWSDSRMFGSKVALLAAHCAERQDDPALAVEFSLLAWERRRDDRTALARIALDADQLGDTVLSGVATEYLWYVNPDQDESLFVEAALALRHGDVGAFDTVDALWVREGRSGEEMNRMRARSWLDVGDPVAAYAELKEGGSRMRRGADSRVMMAEITRRLGLLADADRALDSRLMGRLSGADADAVQARLLVDRGRPDEAAELLAGYALETDEDLVASRWYLARARGDAAAMAAAEADYAAVRKSPLRSLDQYLPISRAR